MDELEQLELLRQQQAQAAPEDLLDQQRALGTRQKMAMMLMQQNQQPQGQMVSGQYVAPNWAQQLAPAINQVAGTYLSGKADSDSIKLAKQLRQAKMSAEQEVMNAMTPTPEKVTELAGPYGQNVNKSGMDVSQPIAVQEAKGPDWAKALAATNNPYGAGKDLRATILKQMNPDTPTSVLEYQYAQKDPRYANYTLNQKRASAPNMTSINNVNAFEPFANKTQGEMGSALVKNFDTLQNIPNQLKTLDKVAELAPKSFAGSLAQQKLDAAKFLNNNLGLNVAPDKIVNTEQLNTVLFTNIMDNLKKMDAQPSQFQQQEMKQGLGNIGTDPTALPKVIQVYKDILVGKATEHNRRVKEAETGAAKMKFPYSIYVPVDAASGGVVDFNSLPSKR